MAPKTRVRMWRWRANPLRRRSDRVEAWVVLLAFLLVTVGGVTTAVLTWSAAYDVAQEQRAERQRVPAVLMQDADRRGRETFYKAPNSDTTRVPVRWTAPDGTVRQGTAQVPDGSRAGSSVPVWIGPDGSPTAAPPGDAMTLVQSGLCAALASGTFVALVCGAQAGVRGRLERQRAAAWERAWSEVEPHWRHRTP